MTYAPPPFKAGDRVAIPFGIGLQHYGIVTAQGTVISNSRKHGGVIEQSLSEFANGKRIRLCESADGLDGHIAVQRARRQMGQSYRLHETNCIDLMQHAYRRRPTAWQVASATATAFGDMFRKKTRY